jgi:hypothetical protein
MIWLSLYILGAVICAMIGRNKGYNFALTFICSLVVTPLLGIIIVLANNPNKPRCKFCKGFMEKDATVCLHCAREQ